MSVKLSRRTLVQAGTAALASVALPSLAQTAWPSKPIKIIVPYTAGGAIDLSVRKMATVLEPALGTIIVDNRPGGGGGIGMTAVARAPADGLTIGIAAVATNAINPWLFPSLPYEPIDDFAPITQMTRIPNVLVVNAEVAAKRGIESFADFMAFAKKESGKLTYASGGNGSAGHLAGELFKRALGLDIVHVPYNGGAPSQLAQLSGQVDFSFDNLASAASNMRAGKLKALAVSSAKRLPDMPNLPTVGELIPGFVAGGYQGMFAPAATPPDVVRKINADLVKVMAMPDLKAKLMELGAEPIAGSPEAMRTFLREDRERWARVIKEHNIKVDQ